MIWYFIHTKLSIKTTTNWLGRISEFFTNPKHISKPHTNIQIQKIDRTTFHKFSKPRSGARSTALDSRTFFRNVSLARHNLVHSTLEYSSVTYTTRWPRYDLILCGVRIVVVRVAKWSLPSVSADGKVLGGVVIFSLFDLFDHYYYVL